MAVARSLCNRGLPPLGSLGGTGHITMFHIWHWKGSGWLCIFGLGLAMLTEVVLRAVTHDLTITAPRSWWLMAGYAVAAAYCVVLHFVLKFLDTKRGVDQPGREHSLLSIPVRYWSIFYIVIGVARVYSPK
jgi:hypothetical protein